MRFKIYGDGGSANKDRLAMVASPLTRRVPPTCNVTAPPILLSSAKLITPPLEILMVVAAPITLPDNVEPLLEPVRQLKNMIKQYKI